MKLDSNAAWNEATASVAANKEVLLALAGVFFMLPSLAFALLSKPPEQVAGLTPEQLSALLMDYYVGVLPALLLLTLVSTIGTLAMLTMFTDRSRPTVGQAISQGALGTFSYLGAQLVVGLAGGLISVLVVGLAAFAGSKVLMVVAVIAVIVAFFYLTFRTILLTPVIAVEKVRNPIIALVRSWRLTQGNTGRIALFFLLLGLGFVVVIGVTMALAGTVLVLVLGKEVAEVIAAVISSSMTAVMSLYFAAVLAAVHRQLAGPSTSAVSETFD